MMSPATLNLRHRAASYGPLAALGAGALAIALAPIFVRVSEVEPIATAFYRLLFAFPVLWGWLKHDEAPQRRRKTETVSGRTKIATSLLIVLAGVLLAGDLAIWHISITLTSVANATVFNNSAPLFVTLFAWLFLRETITGRMLAALAVAIGGMAMMMAEHMQMLSENWLGDLLAITTGIFYGGYILTVKYLRRSFSTIQTMALSSATALPVLFLFTLATGESFGPVTFEGLMILIALGLICHVAGQSLITYALASLPALFSSLGLLIQPIGAAILAWILFGETQSSLQIAGSLVVLMGIAMAPRRVAPARITTVVP